MRLTKSLPTVPATLLGVGLGAWLIAALAGGRAKWLWAVGGIVLLIGAATGAALVWLMHRDSQRLARQIRASFAPSNGTDAVGLAAVAPSSAPIIRSSHPSFQDLCASGNAMLGAARAAIDEHLLRRRELEIELRVANAERQHAEAILYSISDAVLVTDAFGELVLANESAARAFQFDLLTAQHQPVQSLVRDAKVVQLLEEMRQSASGGGRRITEHRAKTADGDRTFKITLSCVNDRQAPTDPAADEPRRPAPAVGVVAVLQDMTREKEVSDMKNAFVSMVSHELRTPLASIKAYVEMLIDGEADNEKTAREFYEVIQNEANRLSRLIDNILCISRIESGLVKVNREPQSLAVIVKEAMEVIAPQARQKNISLVEQLTPVFYQVPAERDMLYQAILNIFSNAIKYTPEGGAITVQTEVNEAAGKVITRIIDSGVGIPPKDLPFVFDKFYRVEANNRMAQGTGLGLSLVKHIVETVHQGRLFVESQVGKGSCFGFELDLAA